MLFLFLGMLLFFDKALLAMGNILFLSGVLFIIGARKTFRFFFQARKAKGTACFMGGIALVLIGWPVRSPEPIRPRADCAHGPTLPRRSSECSSRPSAS